MNRVSWVAMDPGTTVIRIAHPAFGKLDDKDVAAVRAYFSSADSSGGDITDSKLCLVDGEKELFIKFQHEKCKLSIILLCVCDNCSNT